MRPIFGVKPIPARGDFYTPHQAAFPIDPALPWPRMIAYQPSYREVLTPGEPDAGRFMHLTGQSGHPLSPHYVDLVGSYEAGILEAWGGDGSVTASSIK
ncbi:penicillin acylase family protein [Sulfobacillus sp. DSM 109850]|uniref:Penicillin acylase family protein n=1 Tax=Sulfobacillus harzensis TaxID=2729629 RepID=A0A7Y0L957_9FIRM|nr:penicillin acylase family protein [Sulfobacillus harzensis]